MPITSSEAIRRVEVIVPLMSQDIRIATGVAEAMEAANRIIPVGLEGQSVAGAGTYRIVQHSLALKLALDIARIFDVSEGRDLDTQDKASVPVLAYHLNKSEVQAEFIARARQWTPQFPHFAETQAVECETAIKSIIRAAAELQIGEASDALARVRQFRTQRLAHSLFDKEPDPLPVYSDLFMLLASAREIGTAALLAVMGQGTDLEWDAKVARDEADRFWNLVLAGLRSEDLGRSTPPAQVKQHQQDL